MIEQNNNHDKGMTIEEKVFVLHVKTDKKHRKEHIENMLGAMNIPFEFMLNGDVSDITPEIQDRYFKDKMHNASPSTLSSKKEHFTHVSWLFKVNYKKMLYFLR